VARAVIVYFHFRELINPWPHRTLPQSRPPAFFDRPSKFESWTRFQGIVYRYSVLGGKIERSPCQDIESG
jgi:hypothetical protein